MHSLVQWFPKWAPASPGGVRVLQGGVEYEMGDWGVQRVSGGVATFDAGLGVTSLGFCWKSEKKVLAWFLRTIFCFFPQIFHIGQFLFVCSPRESYSKKVWEILI